MRIPPSAMQTTRFWDAQDIEAMKAKQTLPDGLEEKIKSHLSQFKADPAITSMGSEQKHSFTRQTTSGVRNVYALAQSGRINPRHFSNNSDALRFAESALQSLDSYITVVNQLGEGDPTVGGPFTAKNYEKFQPVEGYDEWNAMMEGLESRIADLNLNESNQDRLTANRMNLFTEAKEFALTFNINEPLYSRNADGQLQLGTFDISYNGHKLARSIGDGTLALYRPDGTLAVDRYA